MDIASYIRDIPDFPKPGILFKDITPLLKNAEAFKYSIELLTEPFKGDEIDYVVSIESRGFIFGVPMANALNAGFIPIRKPGKLPAATLDVTYDLEYGQDTLCIHKDSLEPGSKVLLVDDVLATGGTMKAAIELISKLEAEVVGISFLLELEFLNGRKKISNHRINSQIVV